jgi:hypothetical protein
MLQNAGVKILTNYEYEAALPIAGAGTLVCDVVENLEGLTAVTLSLRFAYGSGGTTCKVYVQTRFGAIWVDIACFAFATAAAHKIVNLSGLTPKTTGITPSDGALTDDTCVDGVLGDALRLKAVVAGTYAGSTLLDARAACR